MGKPLQTNNIVLEHNSFELRKDVYHQTLGTDQNEICFALC